MISLLPILTMASMPVSPPCHGPDTAQLDFWIGDWDVTWDGGKGHDRVTRSEDGCEIDDHFDGGSGDVPRSFSVWPAYNDGWAMQWLNSPPQGYEPSTPVYFMGRRVGGDYALEESVGSAPMYYRVLFSDIHKDGFTWHWQAAKDRATWTDKLVAHYVRSKP